MKIRSSRLGHWHVLHTQKGLWRLGKSWAVGSEGGGDGTSKRPKAPERTMGRGGPLSGIATPSGSE